MQSSAPVGDRVAVLKQIRPALALALACSTILGAAAARAADAPSASNELAEVVVTAEKRSSTVQETPISLTALSADDLTRKNLTSLEDIAFSVPGVSMRTAGPGQTEYEMRGLTSAGGSAATVGFYIDETPLSASAVALNGRTVIDPDLFDLNHVEALRGPQGTLYGAGSMGGTIKLVTNQPKLGAFEGATDTSISTTSHGGTNWNISAMLNLPMGDKAALRLVGTDKYVSGFIDRVVIAQGQFPYPTNPSGLQDYPGAISNPVVCFYYCKRGDVASAPVDHIVKGSNAEHFVSGRAALLWKPSDALSITTTLMYQRIDADGYNSYQQDPGGQRIYQPYDQKEPYYDSFKLGSLTVVYDFGPATLTSATSYWKRDVIQSTDSTEALQNINNLTTFIQNLYQEEDPTSQFSQEFRLTSTGSGPLQWQGGLYFANLKSGYITTNQAVGFATASSCGLPSATNPLGGHCDPATQYNPNSTLRYPDATQTPYPDVASAQGSNPNGVVFNDNNPNVMKQSAIFGEVSYKLRDDLKITGGLRFFKYTIENHADQAGLGTASANQDHTILDQKLDGTAVLPRINISYTPTPDLTIYSTLAKGSRPGGVNLPIPLPSVQQLAANPAQYNCGLIPDAPPPPVYVTSQPSFSPDSVWSLEVGEKARFGDRRFMLNADVYYIKWKDIQQVLSLSCGYPYNTNAGDAKAYGPEVEFSARVTNGLTLNVSGSMPKAYINAPTAAALASGITPGTRVINVPRYTAVIGLDYQAAINDKLNTTSYIGLSMTGDSEDQAAYRQDMPSHNSLDARFTLSAAQWSAAVFGTNLTNKFAALTIDNTVFAWQTAAITRVSTNQPRTIGVDFQYKF
jgi:outer membrane receptor protein involved in Fe transport